MTSRFPFPMPNGWFQVAYADEVCPADSLPLHYFGTDLVLSRVPEVPEASSDAWTDFERHRWTVRTHNQEIGENAVDRAHFGYVHGAATVPESELSLDGHIRRAVHHLDMATPRGDVRGKIEVEAHGMGCTTTRFSGICETVVLISHTPIDGECVDSRFSFTQRLTKNYRSGKGVGATQFYG